MDNYSPGLNGIIIALFSSFGSVILVAVIFLVFYFLRHTAPGRIFLDRIGRPGEYDDEQAFAREEAEALETMDDMQRTEYLRAKGRLPRHCGSALFFLVADTVNSLCNRQPSRVCSDRYFAVAIPRHPGEGCLGMGV